MNLRLAWDATTPPAAEFDGHRITWSGWEQVRIFLCPPPKDPVRCDACGSNEPMLTCHGTWHPNPGDTVLTTERRARRSGRAYRVDPYPVPAHPYVRLYATRCPACSTTAVYDRGQDGMQFIDISQPKELTLW